MTLHPPIPFSGQPFPPAPDLQRARGTVHVGVRADGATMRLRQNYQSGSAKVRYPRIAEHAPVEAVLLNTAGGVTGGDHLTYAVTVDAGARAVATTQAAERIYRRSSGVARIDAALSVGDGAALDWLPQETILFDGSALTRTLTAEVAPTARLLAVEAILLGRKAMGETARNVVLFDRWRIRRGGTLCFADALRYDGDAAAVMAGGATGNGSAALATLVLIAPDAEAMIDTARAALDGAMGEAGASAWNGMLVARLIAPDGQMLRAALTRLIETLRGTPMPRVWNT